MKGKPVVLQVTVLNDPVPGTFHTLDSIQETVQRILDGAVGHYHPKVEVDTAASLRARLEADQ